MYKIFIDTNIFIDFYRINTKNSLKQILEELPKYKKYLIFTEQSNDEFFRNREKTITDFIEQLNQQKLGTFDNTFLGTLEMYPDFKKAVLDAKELTDSMIKCCKDLKEDEKSDSIYQLYNSLCLKNVFPRTDDIVNRAIKRKYIGNPPVSDKYTCCDEIIWETLLEYCDTDLIIVTSDKTFKQNKKFLQHEYNLKKGKNLVIVDNISDALRFNDETPSSEFENSEIDLAVEKHLEKYECLQNGSNWISIIYHALVRLNGVGKLQNIYSEVYSILEEFYPEKLKNNNIEATIRGQIERYSSDSKIYNRKIDLFKKIDNGVWSIRIDI